MKDVKVCVCGRFFVGKTKRCVFGGYISFNFGAGKKNTCVK